MSNAPMMSIFCWRTPLITGAVSVPPLAAASPGYRASSKLPDASLGMIIAGLIAAISLQMSRQDGLGLLHLIAASTAPTRCDPAP
jgi:hypothetical protein